MDMRYILQRIGVGITLAIGIVFAPFNESMLVGFMSIVSSVFIANLLLAMIFPGISLALAAILAFVFLIIWCTIFPKSARKIQRQYQDEDDHEDNEETEKPKRRPRRQSSIESVINSTVRLSDDREISLLPWKDDPKSHKKVDE